MVSGHVQNCCTLRSINWCLGTFFKVKNLAPWNSSFRIEKRKQSCGSYKFIRLSTWRRCGLSGFGSSMLEVSPPRKTFVECAYLGSLVNIDGTTASEVLFVDQVLLMTSVFLTYIAGVIPIPKPKQPGKSNSFAGAASDSPTFSGSSGMKIDDQVNSKYALDVVKGKILDFLDAFERRKGLGSEVLEFAECHAKQHLSLNAIAEGPRLRLLWTSFLSIEEEVSNISNIAVDNFDDLSKVVSDFIQRSFWPVCMSWLKSELPVENVDSNKKFLSLMSEKLRGDCNILLVIKKSGKEELYTELMRFLSFGSRRDYCYFNHSLFVKHGISILEDLLITFADGIASMYLEFISIDGSCSDEVDSIGLTLCTMSTRALQRLRNEVAMNQWLHQNVEAIVSMYEDRFDLCMLESQPIEMSGSRHANLDNWWMRLTLRRAEIMPSQFHYAVIRSFSMPVKRTKELRALRGWRYYFSLLIELSDITMPLIRIVIDKISNGISFFLVCLIGRSLGLIYTGIRQSLKWK